MKYTAKFKLQVVKLAQESNNCAASHEFSVNKKLVRDWRKQVEKLKCMPKNKCSNRGKQCQWPELEDKLVTWIEQQRQSGYIKLRTCEHWQYGRDCSLVQHAIGENHQHTRGENGYRSYNWPREVPFYSCPFLPSRRHKVKTHGHL